MLFSPTLALANLFLALTHRHRYHTNRFCKVSDGGSMTLGVKAVSPNSASFC